MRLIPDHIPGIVTVYMEAEGEPYEGKVAVAEVILRRTKRKYFSDGTVTGTCLKRRQFSAWNEDAANRTRSLKIDTDDPIAHDCVRAWADAEAGSNFSKDAMHYYNAKLCFPAWADGAGVVARIGNHTFVIPKEG